ncbi:MAG: hypothetical protein ACLFQK_08945 [Fibrobacterota bacterium]
MKALCFILYAVLSAVVCADWPVNIHNGDVSELLAVEGVSIADIALIEAFVEEYEEKSLGMLKERYLSLYLIIEPYAEYRKTEKALEFRKTGRYLIDSLSGGKSSGEFRAAGQYENYEAFIVLKDDSAGFGNSFYKGMVSLQKDCVSIYAGDFRLKRVAPVLRGPPRPSGSEPGPHSLFRGAGLEGEFGEFGISGVLSRRNTESSKTGCGGVIFESRQFNPLRFSVSASALSVNFKSPGKKQAASFSFSAEFENKETSAEFFLLYSGFPGPGPSGPGAEILLRRKTVGKTGYFRYFFYSAKTVSPCSRPAVKNYRTYYLEDNAVFLDGVCGLRGAETGIRRRKCGGYSYSSVFIIYSDRKVNGVGGRLSSRSSIYPGKGFRFELKSNTVKRPDENRASQNTSLEIIKRQKGFSLGTSLSLRLYSDADSLVDLNSGPVLRYSKRSGLCLEASVMFCFLNKINTGKLSLIKKSDQCLYSISIRKEKESDASFFNNISFETGERYRIYFSFTYRGG